MYFSNDTWIVHETMHFKCTLIYSIFNFTSETVCVFIKRWIKSYPLSFNFFFLRDNNVITIQLIILFYEHVYNQTIDNMLRKYKVELKIYFKEFCLINWEFFLLSCIHVVWCRLSFVFIYTLIYKSGVNVKLD